MPVVTDRVQMLPLWDDLLPVSKEVLDCSSQLHLAPQQKQMRLAIARSLTRKSKRKAKWLELRFWFKHLLPLVYL